MRTISLDAARRIALGAQGFADPRPTGRVDRRHFRRVMGRMGVLQLDSVNVCVRSHYMPFYSRLGPYDRSALDSWLNDSGENIEYWAHVAATIPKDDFPLWRWKMESRDSSAYGRRLDAILEAHPTILDDVYRLVDEDGPITISDVDAPTSNGEPWWDWGPHKYALEVLFHRGEVTVSRTGNFMRRYDTVERAIPEHLRSGVAMPKEEAYRELLLRAARHHGIGKIHDLTDYFRLKIPTAKPIMASLVSDGLIDEVEVPGWDGPVYVDPNAVRPRRISGSTLLTPFDPVVWYRERGERLFGFHYRIEIYVPEKDRVFGYYSLPFMVDGDIVGRVDLKADRKRSTLMVQSAWREEGSDAGRVVGELAVELDRMAGWLGMDDIELAIKGNIMPDLRRRM